MKLSKNTTIVKKTFIVPAQDLELFKELTQLILNLFWSNLKAYVLLENGNAKITIEGLSLGTIERLEKIETKITNGTLFENAFSCIPKGY